MAGSLKTFGYEADNGTVFGVIRDESNSEATVGGVTLMPAFVGTLANLPTGFRLRYVNTVLSTDSNVKRRFWVGRATAFAALVNGSQITEAAVAGGGGNPARVWNVTSKRGERSRLLTVADTGQTDGDNP